MTLEIIRNTYAEGRELTVGMIVSDLSDPSARELLMARKAILVMPRTGAPSPASSPLEPMDGSRKGPRRKKETHT
jgi:hypothetical protein